MNLFKWLRSLRTKIIHVTNILQQGQPHQNFYELIVVDDVSKPTKNRYGLIFNLSAVATLNGVCYDGIDQEYTLITFVNGDIRHALGNINDILEALDLDDEDEDEDDENNDIPTDDDGPPTLTKEQFEAMMK